MSEKQSQLSPSLAPNKDFHESPSDLSLDQKKADPITKELTTSEPEVTYPEGGRGWFVAAGSGGILFATFGFANAFGIFQEYYQKHQLHDSTPSQISWIGSIQIFFLFSAMLFGGPLFDQYGAVFITPSGILFVFSTMMTSIATKYWHFVLAQGVLGGITMGMTMAPCMAATSHYFFKKRGAAMGLVISCSSIGGVCFPLALSNMLYNNSLSFGWTIRICGFIQMVLIGIGCFAIRPRLPPRKGTFFIAAALKNPLFICVTSAALTMMFGLFMPFFFLPTFAVQNGMSTKLASYLVAILNGASFFGRVVPGILGDKLGRLNMMFATGICTGILIWCFSTLKSNATIIVFSALYGFFQGGIISSMTVAMSIIPKDQREIGTYMGMGMSVMSIAVLVGPPVNGAFVTHYHSFTEVSFFSGSFTVVGALMVLLAKHISGKGVLALY